MSFPKRTKARPRPTALKHPDSPLHRLRLQAGLTIPELAQRFSVSTASVARWLSGDRSAPVSFIQALARTAAGDVSEIVAAQDSYANERIRRRRHPPPVIEISLPAGIDVEEAQRICTDALVSLSTARGECRPPG